MSRFRRGLNLTRAFRNTSSTSRITTIFLQDQRVGSIIFGSEVTKRITRSS